MSIVFKNINLMLKYLHFNLIQKVINILFVLMNRILPISKIQRKNFQKYEFLKAIILSSELIQNWHKDTHI